jgi:hypothetical protein
MIKDAPLCNIAKLKVKSSLCFLTEHHAVKAYWGSGGVASRFLHLGTRWNGQFHAPATLPPGKELLVAVG